MASKQSQHVRIALHGDPGSGKTRLLGTSPGKVLIIRPPVDHTDSLLPADKKRVTERVVRDWDDMNQALDYLRHEGEKWDWVWVDSVSLLQDVLLDDIWETVITEKPSRARYGLDKAEYGINMTRLARWFRHVVGPDLFNFGWTGHSEPLESPEKDDDGDPIEKLMPWVQGRQMPQKLCGYMNVVAYLRVNEKGTRVLHTNAGPYWYAKDQFDALDKAKLVSPTMPKLLDAITKKRADAGQPSAKSTRPKRRTTGR